MRTLVMAALGMGVFFSTPSFAESFLAHAAAQASGAMSILSGRPSNPNFVLAKRTVMLATTKPDGKNFERCSGTVIEGCILTAAHCLTPGPETFIYSGEKPDISRPIGSSKTRLLKGAGGSEDDLAILKPEEPLSLEGFTRDDLATEPLADDTGKVTIMGYGIVGSKEEEIEGEVKFVDYGDGRRRAGESWFAGYGTRKEGTPTISNSRTGNVLFAKRTNPKGEMLNLVAGGDSGGPLYHDGKIYGTAIGGFISNPDKLAQALGQNNADHAYMSFHTSMVKTRPWIIEKLDELGCGKVDPGKALAKITREGIYGFNGTYDSENWLSLPQEKIDEMKTHLRKFLKLDPQTEIGIQPSLDLKNMDSISFKVFKDERSVVVRLKKDGTLTRE